MSYILATVDDLRCYKSIKSSTCLHSHPFRDSKNVDWIRLEMTKSMLMRKTSENFYRDYFFLHFYACISFTSAWKQSLKLYGHSYKIYSFLFRDRNNIRK